MDILYGDHEGGQRTMTRFALLPRDDGVWLAAAGRHWNSTATTRGSYARKRALYAFSAGWPPRCA